MQGNNKVIRIKTWSRNILAFNPDKSYLESSTLALETLHPHSSQIAFFLLATNIGTNIEETSKTSTTKNRALTEEKHYKNVLKNRAQCYDQKSVGNIKFRLKTRKI